ncbi:MAG TPA: DUF2851 family protein [Chitinophagales bacterium]|nr:DUF2851 family protein [Chitinophagales bacterium]
MTEKFLHYLWKMKLLQPDQLQASSGEKIQILKVGEHNHNAGPDFLNARIRIGKTEWAGTVEIHVKSAEWNQHRHDQDKAYNNVILHVVYENDEEVFHDDGTPVLSLEVKDLFDSKLFDSYQLLMNSASWIPCEKNLQSVSSITIRQWLHRLMIERLEEKTQPIIESLAENQNNWEDTFYQFIASAFGAKVNAEPFQMLARSLPVKVLAKHKSSLFQLETLLFGTAGFLDEKFADDYPNQLKKEFDFLRKKYALQPMKKHVWKFLRLRPANFPTLRIAQFAQLVFNATHLLSKILETQDVKKLFSYFDCEPSEYWLTHYRFDKLSPLKKKTLGENAIELLMINTVVPFLFVYGKMRDEDSYINQSLHLLEQLPAEENQIITRWKGSGVAVKSAFDSQALLQLKNKYCTNFRCLDCAIGHKILSTT